MDRSSLTTLFDALRTEPMPELIGGEPTPEQVHSGMLDVYRVEEQLVHSVAVGVGFRDLGDLAAAGSAFDLAGQWFEVWASFRAHGISVPFSSLPGTPFYEAARFALEHRPERHEAAVRWMAWAQEINPRIDHFIDVHARLLLALDRRDEALVMVARHRARYPESLGELYASLGDELDEVTLDYAADVERELVARRIQLETRDYILGRAEAWPEHAWTHTPVFEALLAACVPDDHPMMLRLLRALGEDDGRQLRSFVQSYLHPLAKLPEAVRLALHFLESSGFEGWELVRRTIAEPEDHWVEGAWAYLDSCGPREPVVELAWRHFEERPTDVAAFLRPVDPAWADRIRAYLETAKPWEAQRLIPLLPADASRTAFLQMVTAWLQEHLPPHRAQRIAAWLRGETEEDEDALLQDLRPVHSFPGDPRSWRTLPDDDLFRRLTRLATEFDVHAVLVALERQGLPVEEVTQLTRAISVEKQIELLLEHVSRFADLELDEPVIEQPPGRALTRLVREQPSAARRTLSRVKARPYGHGIDLFLRGLKLLSAVAPEVHRDWILEQDSPERVREWVLDWIVSDAAALEWARPRLDGGQRELALLICARRRDEASLAALRTGFAEIPSLRWELGEALATLDATFVTRAAFEDRASAPETKAKLMKKGRSLPSLRWASGDASSAAVSAHLCELVARGVGERQEAAALIALLDGPSQRDLAHALYTGARAKFAGAIPRLVAPYGDERLADDIAADVITLDAKVEHERFMERIEHALELTRVLVTMGAKPQLARLGATVWDQQLRDLIFDHVTLEDTDRAPSSVDFAWLFGVWSAGAWWSLEDWPFEPKLARRLLWDDGAQPLTWDDGFRALDGTEVHPAKVRLARTRPGVRPKAVRRNRLRQLEERTRPENPESDHWDECEGHRVAHDQMRRLLRRRGWRVGAIDREMIYESFYWEVPRLGQGVELNFTYAGDRDETLRGLTFYRLGTAFRPRDFPKGDYLATQLDAPPLTLGEVDELFFHHAVSAVRAVMEAGSGFDPEWKNRY